MQEMGESKHTDMDMQLHQNGTENGMSVGGHPQMPTSTKDIVEKVNIVFLYPVHLTKLPL